MGTKRQHNSRLEEIAADQKLIDGTQQHLNGAVPLTVGSQQVTSTQAVEKLQTRNALRKDADAKHAAWQAAVKAEHDGLQQTDAFVRSYRRIVTGMFEQSPDTLASFGLTAPKLPTMTSEARAKAVAKRTVTYRARHPKVAPASEPQGNASADAHTGASSNGTPKPAT